MSSIYQGDLFGQRNPWATEDLYQPQPQNPAYAYASQFQQGQGPPPDAGMTPYEFIEPIPEMPDVGPPSSIEAFAGRRGMLGTLGSIKASKRNYQMQQYQQRLARWRYEKEAAMAKSLMEHRNAQEKANAETAKRLAEAEERKGMEWVRTQDGRIVKRAAQEGDQPYKEDLSRSEHEDVWSAFKRDFGREPTFDESMKIKERLARAGKAPPNPPQPPTPSYQRIEATNLTTGEVKSFAFDARTGRDNVPAGWEPHKTGVEKTSKDQRVAIEEEARKLRAKLIAEGNEPNEVEKGVKIYKEQALATGGSTEETPNLPVAPPGMEWKRHKRTGEIGLFNSTTGARVQ
jgi:hypothetical protein